MKESKFHMVDLSQAITMPLIRQGCINVIQTQLSSEPGPNNNLANTSTGIGLNNSNSLNISSSNLSENEIRQIAEQSALELEDAHITPQTKQALDKLLIVDVK